MSKMSDDTGDKGQSRGLSGDSVRQSRAAGRDHVGGLAQQLAASVDAGRLFLAEERMLLFRQEAFGFLRTALIRYLGSQRADATLSQFGYLCGLGDYHPSNSSFTPAALSAGSRWLGWTGLAELEPLHIDFDRTRGYFLFRGRFRNSYEAELHLDQFGSAEQPVCVSLTGYASGWCTAFFGQPVLAVEERCAAQGDEFCQFEVRPLEQWGPGAERWREALTGTGLTAPSQFDGEVDATPVGTTDARPVGSADARPGDVQPADVQPAAEGDRRDDVVRVRDGSPQIAQLRRENRELTEHARAKSEFLADVSHEFRTPLTLMLGPLQNIIDSRGDTLEPSLAFELRRIQRNGERLYRLVNEMLDFTKLEAGAMRTDFQPSDILVLAQTVLDDARWQAESKQISLTMNAEAQLPQQLVDERMIEKCLINLISNALHFTPTHGRVALTIAATAIDFSLVVEDTGPGIPAAQQPYLFQRFRQADLRPGRSRDRAQQGTGLGLALVKRFAELHGGRVELDSQPGHGARFTVRLPRRDSETESTHRTDEWRPAAVSPRPAEARRPSANTDAAPIRTIVDDSARIDGWKAIVPRFERAEPPARPAPLALRKNSAADLPLVLVADDDPDVRGLIAEILHPLFEVVEAEDGQDAWQAICVRPPDVAVLDVMMPRLDGLELVRRIKSEPLLRMIPCILVTANAGRNASVSALDSGADDFLAKPFFADELSARVRAAARMRRMYGELHESRARLSALETQHSAIIDNASDGIVVFERGGRIHTWNRTMRQIFGYEENQVRAQSIEILALRQLGDSDGYQLAEESRRWLRRAEFHSCEWRLRHRDGQIVDVESSRSEITINQEPLFVEVIRDIRERKRAEKRLAEANRQLLSMSRVAGKAELATGVLHNVGNVLQSVKVNVAKLDELVATTRIERLTQAVAMLGGERADLVRFLTQDSKGMLLPRYLGKVVRVLGYNLDSARRAVDDANLGIEQIETIVRAQQENARTVLVKTPIVLNALVGDVLRLLDLRGPAPRIVHLSGGDQAFTLDRHRIVDILINLLDNAFDATAHLPVDEREVTLRTEIDGDWLRISVADNGVGIAEGGLTNVFAHGYTSKPSGRGFGLHVSALSAREMNGSLRAHSAGPGRGARFVLELPTG